MRFLCFLFGTFYFCSFACFVLFGFVCLYFIYFFFRFLLFFGTVPVFYLERVRKGVYLGVCEYRENMEVVGEVENVIRRNYEKYIFNKSMQL